MTGVGTLLRRYREAAGLSQEELAERAGLSARGVSDLERGLRRNPYPATLRRLAEALELRAEHRAVLLAAAHAAPGDDQIQPQPSTVEHGAYLGARASVGLVGRARERAAVQDGVEAALGGSGRLLLLEGEAGIGKTRLAQELAAVCAARGSIVSTGRCYEPYKGVAFYPFLDALAMLYAEAPVELRRALSERWPYLERLLPDVFPALSGARSDSPDELQRLLRSAAGFVRACAEARPVALLVDDLQWADRASIDLLQHLVRHTRGQPVLIGGTVREPGLGSTSSLRHAAVDLQREGLLQRVRLERLDRADTAALLREQLGAAPASEDLVDLIHAASGGNPFFALEVLQTLRARGQLISTGGEWIGQAAGVVLVPDSVRESVLERLTRLSPTSVEVIDAAAALGQAFSADELAAVLPIEDEAIETALLDAIAIGFVRAPVPHSTVNAEADSTYAFVHALTHQALYERMSPRRRRRLHVRAAEALEGLPAPVRARRAPEIAHHLQMARESARALPYLLLAGDQAEAVFAHDDARQHYQAAARVAAEAGDPVAEARALVGLGRGWLAAGHPERALEHFEAAARMYRTLDDAESEGETLARVAQVYFARGNWDAGLQRLPPLIDRLEQRQPTRALALLYACLAAVMPADPAQRIRAASRASELSRSLGDDDLWVQAEANRGFVLMLAGRLSEARAALEAVLPLAEARRVHDALPMVLGALSEITKLQGDLRGYLVLAQRAVARAEQAGDTVALVGALSGVGEAEFLLGDWTAARRTYTRAEIAASHVDADWYRGFVQLGLAAMDVAEGNWTAAEQHLAECLVDTPRLGHHNRREHALRLLARRDLLAEAADTALHRLDEVTQVEGESHAGTQALRAWGLLESGDLSHAAEAVSKSIQLAKSQGNQLDLCEALLVSGDLHRRLGDMPAAASTLCDALSLARAMPCPYAEARIRYARAQLFACLHRNPDARQELEQAITTFKQLAARPYLDKSERLLHSLPD